MSRPDSALSQMPELRASHGASIRLPELRNVPLTARVQAILDHPALQRLRQIRQLGPTHLVYPGAVHTRFEHSLGVMGCAQWFLRSLLELPPVRDALCEQDVLCVLAAALLHDVGHYPFAHSLEALHLKGRDTPRHEHIGGRIIRGEFAALAGGARGSIASILERDWGVDPERVIRLCTGDDVHTPIDRLLRSILSGTIDADKMDYLERDSHHMGVPYGRHYDRQRLLASLTLNQAEDGVAIEAKGKVSAEMFVFSRYTMFSEAYWHHTVRAASAMVENAMAAFHSRQPLEGDDLIVRLLSMHDDDLLSWLYEQSPSNSAPRLLLGGVVGYNRALYKRVMTLSQAYQEEDKRRAYDIIYQLDAQGLYALTDRLRVELSRALGQPLHPASLIFDTPPRDKDRLETIQIVYPGASGVQHYPLHQLSRIVAGIQHDFVRVVKKIRLFAEPTTARLITKLPHAHDLILQQILATPSHESA